MLKFMLTGVKLMNFSGPDSLSTKGGLMSEMTTAWLADGTKVEVALTPPKPHPEIYHTRRALIHWAGREIRGHFVLNDSWLWGFEPDDPKQSVLVSTLWLHEHELDQWEERVIAWDVPRERELIPLSAKGQINIQGRIDDSEFVRFRDIPINHVFAMDIPINHVFAMPKIHPGTFWLKIKNESPDNAWYLGPVLGGNSNPPFGERKAHFVAERIIDDHLFTGDHIREHFVDLGPLNLIVNNQSF